MPPKRKAGGSTSSPSTTPTVSSATLDIAANGTGAGCEVAVVVSSGGARARRGSELVGVGVGGSAGGVGVHETGSESAASSSRRSAVYSAIFGGEEEEEDEGYEHDSGNENYSFSNDESSASSPPSSSLSGRLKRGNGGTGISFSFNSTTTNPSAVAEATILKPSISLKRKDDDEDDDDASSVLSATSSLSICTNSSHNSLSHQQQPSPVHQTLFQPGQRQRTLSGSIYNRQSLGGAGMFTQQGNLHDDDEAGNKRDQEDGSGGDEEEEEEEELDDHEGQADLMETLQEHKDDGAADENNPQLVHPPLATTAAFILTAEASAALVQASGISTAAAAADGQNSSKENHQADASADFQPPNTPPDSKPVNGSPNEPKHLERALDEKERIRRLAYKALQEIEADFAKFKNKFYLEESFKIDMEIKTVRDGTHARIASETATIESRKRAFDAFSSERLCMLLVRYEGECAAAVEIANVEFVRKKAEARSQLMGEAVRNCSLLTEEMRRYHMPHRDRGVSHKRRKTRRHDYAEWKCIMEDDLLDDALPSGPASSFSLHSAPTSGHYNHHSHHSYHHHPAHALAPHAATVKRKPQMTAASVYGYFPSAHVNGLSAQRVEEDLVFLGIK